MRRGFTLIEIMVVVIVIGVLSSLVVPQFMGSFQRAALSTAADDLVTTLGYLQRRAAVSQRTYRLVFDTAGDGDREALTCHAEASSVELDEPEAFLPLTAGPVKPMTLPRGVRVLEMMSDAEPMDGDPPNIAFYPSGSADAAIVQLTSGDAVISIVVEPTAGRVYRVDGAVNELPNLREDLDV